MMKKTTFFAAIACLLLVSCDKEEDDIKQNAEPTNTFLLAGENMKAWQPGEEFINDCEGAVERIADNQWQFHSDNSFTYDRGTVVEDACETSDIVNVYGKWNFNEAEDSLFVLVIGKVQDGENIEFAEEDQMYLIQARLLKLTEEELIIQQSFPGETFEGHFNAID